MAKVPFHVCGTINDNLTLSDRVWTCDCGAALDRDVNAAINLRNLAIRTVSSTGTGLWANACGEDVRLAYASNLVEAGTERQSLDEIRVGLGERYLCGQNQSWRRMKDGLVNCHKH